VEVEEHNRFLDFTMEKLVYLQNKAHQRGEPVLDLISQLSAASTADEKYLKFKLLSIQQQIYKERNK